MPGTRKGGKSASSIIREKYGDNHYKRIGKLGGGKSRGGGFASTQVGKDGLTGSQRAKLAGRIGGQLSKRSKKDEDK